MEVLQALQAVHGHAKALHQAQGHVHVRLADQLVGNADVDAALALRQWRGHQQRGQVLAAHLAGQDHLLGKGERGQKGGGGVVME